MWTEITAQMLGLWLSFAELGVALLSLSTCGCPTPSEPACCTLYMTLLPAEEGAPSRDKSSSSLQVGPIGNCQGLKHVSNKMSDLPDSVPLLSISAGLLLGHFVGAGTSSADAVGKSS